MQKLIIAGACGKDAELRRTGQGEEVLNWSIAVSNGKDKDGNHRPATWYDAALWGKRAESLAPHIKKGDKLTLIGRPSVRVHDGKAYFGITVEDLTFMGASERSDGGSVSRHSEPNGKREPPSRADLDEDSIPF